VDPVVFGMGNSASSNHGLANPVFSCISSFVFQANVSNYYWML
jgi:hypothetical protein